MRGDWLSQLSGSAVPLSKIQSQIMRLLASHRDPKALWRVGHLAIGLAGRDCCQCTDYGIRHHFQRIDNGGLNLR